MQKFETAQEAFEHHYYLIKKSGLKKTDSQFLNNVGFYILNPVQNEIKTPFRKWSKKYADREWAWYLSKNQNVSELIKYAPIWDKMHTGDFIVNSNYGYQWNRDNQLLHVIQELQNNKETRRAVLTIYDGKEHQKHQRDTPCTLNIVFNIIDNKLNMSVLMRSNDLWYGFCNDQYCFSKLQQEIAKLINLEVGWYYHFANDLHLYNNQL